MRCLGYSLLNEKEPPGYSRDFVAGTPKVTAQRPMLVSASSVSDPAGFAALLILPGMDLFISHS